METLRDAKLVIDGKTYVGKGEIGAYANSNNDNRKAQHGVFYTHETALPDGYQESETENGPSAQFKDVAKSDKPAEFAGYEFGSPNQYRAAIHLETSHPIGNSNLHQVTFTLPGAKDRITD